MEKQVWMHYSAVNWNWALLCSNVLSVTLTYHPVNSLATNYRHTYTVVVSIIMRFDDYVLMQHFYFLTEFFFYRKASWNKVVGVDGGCIICRAVKQETWVLWLGLEQRHFWLRWVLYPPHSTHNVLNQCMLPNLTWPESSIEGLAQLYTMLYCWDNLGKYFIVLSFMFLSSYCKCIRHTVYMELKEDKWTWKKLVKWSSWHDF